MPICSGRSGGDDVKIYGSRKHFSIVVVGMIAGNFASSRYGEKGYLTVLAKELGKFVYCVYVTRFLRFNVFSSVQLGEDFVIFAAFYGGDYLFCVHDVTVPFCITAG